MEAWQGCNGLYVLNFISQTEIIQRATVSTTGKVRIACDLPKESHVKRPDVSTESAFLHNLLT